MAHGRVNFDDMSAAHNAAVPIQDMINFEFISGGVSFINFKSGCGNTNRPNVINFGNLSKAANNMYVAPELDKMNQPISKSFTIPDGVTHELNLSRFITLGYLTVAYQNGTSSGFASAMIRAIKNPSTTTIVEHPNIVFATDVSDINAQSEKLTISVSETGTISLINKFGSSANICFSLSCWILKFYL